MTRKRPKQYYIEDNLPLDKLPVPSKLWVSRLLTTELENHLSYTVSLGEDEKFDYGDLIILKDGGKYFHFKILLP